MRAFSETVETKTQKVLAQSLRRRRRRRRCHNTLLPDSVWPGQKGPDLAEGLRCHVLKGWSDTSTQHCLTKGIEPACRWSRKRALCLSSARFTGAGAVRDRMKFLVGMQPRPIVGQGMFEQRLKSVLTPEWSKWLWGLTPLVSKGASSCQPGVESPDTQQRIEHAGDQGEGCPPHSAPALSCRC